MPVVDNCNRCGLCAGAHVAPTTTLFAVRHTSTFAHAQQQLAHRRAGSRHDWQRSGNSRWEAAVLMNIKFCLQSRSLNGKISGANAPTQSVRRWALPDAQTGLPWTTTRGQTSEHVRVQMSRRQLARAGATAPPAVTSVSRHVQRGTPSPTLPRHWRPLPALGRLRAWLRLRLVQTRRRGRTRTGAAPPSTATCQR